MELYEHYFLLTEEQIFKLIRKPKTREKGFQFIVNQYQERLYWHIRKIVLSHDDADDVLQNTFIKVWKALDSFRGESRLYTWMYRIATNECLSHLQQQKRKFISAFAEQDYAELNLTDDPYFDGDEATTKLWVAVESLPEKQKLVFKMKYFEDMKYEDISKILGTSVGGLKASYHHAVSKIKEQIVTELNL